MVTLFEQLFQNVGKTIKGIAILTFIMELIGSVIGTVYLILNYENIAGGLLICIFGSFIAIASLFLIYGFGILVERAEKDLKTNNTTKNYSNSNDNTKYIKIPDTEKGTCEKCLAYGPIEHIMIQKGEALEDAAFCNTCMTQIKEEAERKKEVPQDPSPSATEAETTDSKKNPTHLLTKGVCSRCLTSGPVQELTLPNSGKPYTVLLCKYCYNKFSQQDGK